MLISIYRDLTSTFIVFTWTSNRGQECIKRSSADCEFAYSKGQNLIIMVIRITGSRGVIVKKEYSGNLMANGTLPQDADQRLCRHISFSDKKATLTV